MEFSTVTADIDVQMYLPEGGPGWVSVLEDVVSGIKAVWGITGVTPKDRVANPGDMSLEVDNNDTNSGGVRGYYSIGHASCREGFAVGTPIRLVLSHPLFGTRVRWVGTVESAPPIPGVLEPKTKIRCVDWMEEAILAHPHGLEVMVDTQADLVFLQLLTSVDRQPDDVVTSAGSDQYPFALDNVQDESSTIRDEFEKLAMSEYGFIYVTGGRLVFEGRSVRATARTPVLTLSEDENIVAMDTTHQREDIFNRAQVSVHPRKRDASATTVLFTLESALFIPRLTSVPLNAPYKDPDQLSQRIGGIDMVDPLVAGTDYNFNSAEDGTGTDETAQLSIAATFGGNAADLVITNNGPFDGYIPAGDLQLRGRSLKDFSPVISDRQDAASVAAFGQNVFPFDMPYQSNPMIGDDTAVFIVFINKDAKTRVISATFMANWDDDLMLHAFDRDISDVLQITAPSIGVDGLFYINGISLDISLSGAIAVKLILVPADTTVFWTLDVDGATELDETTVLGYGLFVSRWIVGVDELNSSTFLN